MSAHTRQGDPADVFDYREQEAEESRSQFEDRVQWQLRLAVPEHVRFTVLANRSFADIGPFFEVAGENGFEYVIRFEAGPSSSRATATRGQLGAIDGQAKRLDQPLITRKLPSKDTPSPSPSSPRALLRHDPYSHRTATTTTGAAPSNKSIPKDAQRFVRFHLVCGSRMRFSQMPLSQSGARGSSHDQAVGALTATDTGRKRESV